MRPVEIGRGHDANPRVSDESRRLACDGYGCIPADLVFVGISAGRRGGLITKVPFTKDASGRILQRCLGMLGLSLSDEYSVKPKLVNCYVTNLVKGTILGETGKNRKPTADEIAYWLPALREEVTKVEPRRILALGKQVYDSIQPEFSHVIPLRHPRWFQSHGAIKAGSSAFKDMMKHYESAIRSKRSL